MIRTTIHSFFSSSHQGLLFTIKKVKINEIILNCTILIFPYKLKYTTFNLRQ